jgi:hypothetical protein
MSELYPLNEEIVVPDVAEPVLGFRCWDYSISRAELCSLYGVWRIWPRNVPMQAVCTSYVADAKWKRWRNTDNFSAVVRTLGTNGVFEHPPEAYEHKAPHKPCKCGIYAAYEPKIVVGYADIKRVFGIMEAWGKVIPGSNGFRAEFARPACLFNVEGIHTYERRQLQRLAEEYDIPLVNPHSLDVEDYREGVRSGAWKNLVEP